MRRVALSILVGALAVVGATCAATAPDEMSWLKALIQRLESAPVRNPPASITEYRYKERLVYFVPAACCDIFSDLYDKEGELICHPDGGFTGRGDGRCRDFLSERAEGRLIWSDSRARE